MYPGSIVLTRIPWSAHSEASCRIKASTPPFEALYPTCGCGWFAKEAETDDTLTITPPPASIIARPQCFEQKKTPVRFTSRTSCQSSASIASAGTFRVMPALFTSTSTPPKRSTVRSMSSHTDDSSATSTGIAAVSTPVASATALAARSPASSSRFATTTSAPASASARAIALPMPRLPPVTTAVRSSSENASSTDTASQRSPIDSIPFTFSGSRARRNAVSIPSRDVSKSIIPSTSTAPSASRSTAAP